MAHRTADVVVIGAGIMGTSIAFELARSGEASVLLLERDRVAAGDSGLSFSMVRRHYSNEATARLAMRGTDVIKDWAEEVGVGESGYVRTGYLLTVDEPRLEPLRENVRRLQGWGLETAALTPDEIGEVEPLLRLDGIAGAAHEPDGGFADSQKMALSWFAAALAAGATTELGRTVTALRRNGDRVTGVETDAGVIEAGTVVNAAGAWGAALAATAGAEVPLELRRLQVCLLRQAPAAGRVATTISDAVTNLVIRPDRGDIACVVAYLPPEELAGRDDCRETVDPDYEPAVRAALAERMPAYAGAEWVGGFAGAYDITPDWNPVIGPAPGAEGLYLALGWSGHGFKLAPAVGEVVAAEVLGREPAIDLSELRPDRFERGALLRLAYGPGARA